jgi:Flp pilus assembly protein TadG
VLIWFTIAFTVLMGFLALAVDFGRVMLERTELQNAADAAALGGAMELPSITDAITQASAIAARNYVSGQPLVLLTNNAAEAQNDVQFVTWDSSTRTYSLLTGTNRTKANGVRVVARRTEARGNAIPLYVASMIGIRSLDSTASAVASYAVVSYGVVGLDYIKMGGNTTTSYWSSRGSASAGPFGNIASNGNITLSGSSFINGNANPGVAGTVSSPAKVSGSVQRLKEPLSFPALPEDAPTNYESVNQNSNFSMHSGVRSGPPSTPSLNYDGNTTYTLPGGVYFVNNFTVRSSATVAFQGPTTIFCFGNFTMSGSTSTAAGLPKNLTVVTVSRSGNPPGTVTIGSSSALHGRVYAPLSPIVLSGTGDIYGSVLGKSIDMTGTSAIHYDIGLSATGPSLAIVD